MEPSQVGYDIIYGCAIIQTGPPWVNSVGICLESRSFGGFAHCTRIFYSKIVVFKVMIRYSQLTG